jgi:hypothetical protein
MGCLSRVDLLGREPLSRLDLVGEEAQSTAIADPVFQEDRHIDQQRWRFLPQKDGDRTRFQRIGQPGAGCHDLQIVAAQLNVRATEIEQLAISGGTLGPHGRSEGHHESQIERAHAANDDQAVRPEDLPAQGTHDATPAMHSCRPGFRVRKACKRRESKSISLLVKRELRIVVMRGPEGRSLRSIAGVTPRAMTILA